MSVYIVRYDKTVGIAIAAVTTKNHVGANDHSAQHKTTTKPSKLERHTK